MVTRVVLDLAEQVGGIATGERVEVPVAPGDAETVVVWCRRTGNELVEIRNDVAVVRRGPIPDAAQALADVPADRWPGARMWLYTNFDCNLACDYCCARSSPQTERRALGLDRIRRLATEAVSAGVSEVFLTGGEPFLLTDLDQIVAACAERLPTTLLTNAMLFRGTRLAMLRRMPRDNFTLQISLDSATPDLHDRHRGRGSWQRALDGIRTAQNEGFRVRVAATVTADEAGTTELQAFHALLDKIGIERSDQVVRPVAKRGFADDGVVLTTESLLPEITITADGIYWHPVGADHDDQLVSRDIFPLDQAIADIQRQFLDYRRSAVATAQRFPCA